MSEKLQLRITDSALSKDMFPNDYEGAGLQPPRPIKWMSYEAITDRVVSTATDVVSIIYYVFLLLFEKYSNM